MVLLLGSWPALAVWALAGAGLLWAYGLVVPARYRATAEVMVNSNPWIEMPSADRLIIDTFVNQQTLRFEGIAYSDAVWDGIGRTMAQEGYAADPSAVQGLQAMTRLPHPEDGVWRFTAYGRDPALAARLADVWAQAFVDVIDDGVRLAQRDQALRDAQEEATRLQARLLAECARHVSLADEIRAVDQDLAGQPADSPADPAVSQMLQITVASLGGACESLPSCDAPTTIADQRALAAGLLSILDSQGAACQAAIDEERAQLRDLQLERDQLAAGTIGVSASTEVAFVRSAAIPEQREPAPGWSLLVGAGIGVTVGGVLEQRRRREPRLLRG